jgi:hypothetical protein
MSYELTGVAPIRYGNCRLDSGFIGIQAPKMTLKQFIAKRGLSLVRLSAWKPVLFSMDEPDAAPPL